MGDAACPITRDGQHDWAPGELVPLTDGGLAIAETCRACGALAYEPSAADEPGRPPLDEPPD